MGIDVSYARVQLRWLALQSDLHFLLQLLKPDLPLLQFQLHVDFIFLHGVVSLYCRLHLILQLFYHLVFLLNHSVQFSLLLLELDQFLLVVEVLGVHLLVLL